MPSLFGLNPLEWDLMSSFHFSMDRSDIDSKQFGCPPLVSFRRLQGLKKNLFFHFLKGGPDFDGYDAWAFLKILNFFRQVKNVDYLRAMDDHD